MIFKSTEKKVLNHSLSRPELLQFPPTDFGMYIIKKKTRGLPNATVRARGTSSCEQVAKNGENRGVSSPYSMSCHYFRLQVSFQANIIY